MKAKLVPNPFYQKSWGIYLFVTTLIIFVWHKVLNQTFLGEGYFYFNKKLYLFKGWAWPDLGDYDNFAKLFFQVITPFFKDKLIYYQATALAIVIIFFIVFYKILKRITDDKFIAITSTIFLSTNYLALFEYLGAGNYQRFIQRFPNLIPLVIAFYFLWDYCNSKKTINLAYSILLYSLSIIMGHFSALMLPFFLIYPVVKILGEKINYKKLVSVSLICAIYVFISYLLSRYSLQKPSYSLIDFLKNEPNILWRVFYQIPVITIPLDLFKYISLKHALIMSFGFYILGGYVVIRRLPKFKTIYVAFFLTMISVMFTYLYPDPRLDVTKSFGEDRYYLLSSLFAVVIWSMILKALFVKHSTALLITSTLILSSFIIYNASLIRNHMEKIQYQSQMFNTFINYFQENNMNIKDGSIVVAPYYLTFASPLISDVILKDKRVEFILPSTGWEKIYRIQKDQVYVFDYDNGNPWKDSYNPISGHLVDQTMQYRNGQKINFVN